jgi:hypothetical protein
MTMRKSGLLAAVALAMIAASPGVATAPDLGYPTPNGWAPSRRNGNNRREDSAKRHAKAKTAKKSRQQQRRRAKGKA